MLGKLIKHEFKATSKLFFILYAAIIIVAALDSICLYVNSDVMFIEVLKVVFSATYGMGIVAIFVMSAIFIVKRFYDNMLKAQGYLSFTLPVTTNAHILSKLIVSLVWQALTCVVTLITVIIMCIGRIPMREIIESAEDVIKAITEYGLWGTAVKGIIFFVIAVAASILTFYFCLSVGQLLNKHKVLGAVGTYFGIYIVLQIIGTFIISIVTLCMESVDPSFYYSYSSEEYGFLMEYTWQYADMLLNAYLILYVLLLVIYYVGTVMILNKKLNLE